MTTREKAIQIFKTAVAAVQPALLIPDHLFIENKMLHIFDQRFLVSELQHIYVIGAGKASAAMAKTVEEILGALVTAGIVVTKYGHALHLQKIICLEAAHPVPDMHGLEATAKTIQLLQFAGPNDIVICLISGGASSLWIDVPAGASLTDVQLTFQLLLNSGATIDEVNTIRKHLSVIKGGQLLQYAPQAKWFSFIIADVPGNDLSIIASGPTVAGDSTFYDVKIILEKYALAGQLPAPILQYINDGISGIVDEIPGEDDPVFKQVINRVIGNNSIALKAAVLSAGELGYSIASIDNNLNGDAAAAGRHITCYCKQYAGNFPACFLFGGETTVTVTGTGMGGRNQQMVLSALLEMDSGDAADFHHSLTFLSAGTDGTDGPTDAAGAIADEETLLMMREKKLDARKYLNDNDAYHFFEQTNGLIKTGATQTNVMDLVVVIIE
ncbi:MAG: DUF4147 domain-containing protein [Ferruginibacter sp.]|nr:DUF4147 domain-containing protein [Ferruginibacter sp.]